MPRIPGAERAGVNPGAQPTPPGVKLWNAIEGSPQAIEALTNAVKGPIRRTVLETYLTTNVRQVDLQEMARVRSSNGIVTHLHKSMEIIFPHLPQEVRDEYGTPENALHARVRQSWSEAQSRRWQHYREVEKPAGKSPFSEKGRANIRANSGRRKTSPNQEK